MKRIIASLLTATAWTGVWGVAPAQAEPVSTFFIGLGAGLTAGAGAAGAYLGTLGAGFAVGQFLAANAATLLIAGASLLWSAFQNRQMESSQINFRQPNAVRRHAAGIEEVGGSIGFASYDATGAFWYMVIHCDSELMETVAIKFDDVVIAKDGNNRVTTEEFIAEESGWFGFSSRKPYFTHWLAGFTADDPVPPMPAAFTAAFPEWTADHKLAGCTVSIVKIDPIADEKDLSGVYRWRGPIGLGEPAVSIVGVWSRIRDPRKPGHLANDPTTWEKSTNPALIAAWHRTRRQGFNMAANEINWDLVADAADKCDVSIEDRYGDSAPLYSGGGMWDENRENIAIEADILAGCDGQTMFDSEGRWYPKVGFWEEPTLTLTADRDILAMSDSEAGDGEAELDGVVVEYKEPSLGYVMQPCAPWKNPNFYVEGREPRYLTLKVPFCKNHRQAVTLAKAYGRRAQPTMRIAPQTSLRGRRAKRERIISLDYDQTITGNWQVAAPVQLDSAGVSALLMLVPAYPDNWTLLEGEEGEKPTGETIVRSNEIPEPTGVEYSVAPIAGTSGESLRIEATFDLPTRLDDRVELQYKAASGTDWLPFTVIMEQQLGYTDIVNDGRTYDVRARIRRGSRTSDWAAEDQISVVGDPVSPGAMTGVSVGGTLLGKVDIAATAPAFSNVKRIRVYRNTGGALNRATDLLDTIPFVAGQPVTKAYGVSASSLLTNGGFTGSATGWTLDTDWSYGSNQVSKVAGAANRSLTQSGLSLTSSTVYRVGFTITAWSAGNILPRLQGGATANGTQLNFGAGTGRKSQKITATAAHTALQFTAFATTALSMDDVVLFAEAPGMHPQGSYQYWLVAENNSGVEGDLSGPHSVHVI